MKWILHVFGTWTKCEHLSRKIGRKINLHPGTWEAREPTDSWGLSSRSSTFPGASSLWFSKPCCVACGTSPEIWRRTLHLSKTRRFKIVDPKVQKRMWNLNQIAKLKRCICSKKDYQRVFWELLSKWSSSLKISETKSKSINYDLQRPFSPNPAVRSRNRKIRKPQKSLCIARLHRTLS